MQRFAAYEGMSDKEASVPHDWGSIKSTFKWTKSKRFMLMHTKSSSGATVQTKIS